MKNYPQTIKNKLKLIIKKMSESVETFVKNPIKDFTRNRKLTFENLINFLLSMNGNSLSKELLEYFKYNENTLTASALIQQRHKLLPETFNYLFKEFTDSYEDYKNINGYRILAIDGSKLNIPHNPNDSSTYIKCNKKKDYKGYNTVNINAMFDLVNRLYIDANIQPIRTVDERQGFLDMLEKSKLPNTTLIIADRGYESYNVFAHLQEKKWKYLIRIRDGNQSTIAESLNLPTDTEFDEKINLILTRRNTKEVKANPQIYKFLPNTCRFDYIKDKNDYYKISFRLVRFKISENTYETLITNTDKTEFSAKKLKELYHMRWGIETSFRELKYAVGLVNLHSKKMDFIIQEIFAKLTMYNFCEMITLNVIISQKQSNYMYQANFTLAIHICKNFFKHSDDKNPLNVELLIQRYILPIRIGRQAQRCKKVKSSMSFLYRIS